jgi:hypothetical protein
VLAHSAARVDALSMKGGTWWSIEERKLVLVDAGCSGRTTCPHWSDGAGGDGSSIASSWGGQSKLRLAAAIGGGSKPPGSVFSAADANFMASETSKGAGALSSTVRTPPDSPGPSAEALGHRRQGVRRGAWAPDWATISPGWGFKLRSMRKDVWMREPPRGWTDGM